MEESFAIEQSNYRMDFGYPEKKTIRPYDYIYLLHRFVD